MHFAVLRRSIIPACREIEDKFDGFVRESNAATRCFDQIELLGQDMP